MKSNKYSIFIFLVLICSTHCAYKIWDKEEFYNEQKSDKKGLDYYNNVIDDLKKILNYYVYIDLAKNPPQPSFDKDYFPKVDTYAELKKIRSELTEETNYYDFFRKIRILIDSYRDAHMSYGLRIFPSYYVFLCPIKLATKEPENGTVYMTAELAFNDETYFKNGTDVFKIIKENEGQPISSINGQSPFDFIQNFGDKFFNLKNPQATYSFKTHNYIAPFILYFPFDENEIGFNVEYSNGASFETEFAIAEIIRNSENLNDENIYYFFNDVNIEKDFMNYFEKNFINNDYGVPKSLYEILTDYEKSKGINKKNDFNSNNIIYRKNTEFNYENILAEDITNINWDYEYPGKSFQCRVDNKHQLNVINMPTFQFDNDTLIIQLIKKCVELFDTNNYKIVLILNQNGGGIELVSQSLVEYIQPYITSRFYSTFRKGEYLDKYYDFNFEDHSIVETCKVPDKKYVLDNTNTVDYGDGVINKVTYSLRRFGQYRKEFNEEKKIIKNKRKPTDILIFTDGYSASSASLFTKSLQNEGGAIIVGFNGNPLDNSIFDGSQHFSSVFHYSELVKLEPELMDKMENEGIYFTQICRTSNFFDYREYKYPEEYCIKEVDVVSNIYESFDQDVNYDLFMHKANEIFNQYENNKCNYKNKKLAKLDDKCSFSDDKLAHGGHPCDDNGYFDLNRCIKVYCDEGYLLDYKENKCVEDPCLEHKKEDFSSNIKVNQILFVLLSLITLL